MQEMPFKPLEASNEAIAQIPVIHEMRVLTIGQKAAQHPALARVAGLTFNLTLTPNSNFHYTG